MFTKKKTKEPDSLEHAHAYCLFLLGLRLRTEGEIKEKMRTRGYAPGVIQSELVNLKDNNYINDQRFAEIFTDNLKRYKYYGYYQIKKKLMEKRLPSQIIQNALKEYLTPDDELTIGKKFLKKHTMSTNINFKDKQKMALRLKTRGFRSDVISKLIT